MQINYIVLSCFFDQFCYASIYIFSCHHFCATFPSCVIPLQVCIYSLLCKHSHRGSINLLATIPFSYFIIFFIIPFRWNFSVGAFDVSFLSHPDHTISNCNKYSKSTNLEMRFNIALGLLEAVTSDHVHQVKWSFKFDSPIADVWRYHDKVVQPVDLFRHGPFKDLKDAEVPSDAVLYLG